MKVIDPFQQDFPATFINSSAITVAVVPELLNQLLQFKVNALTDTGSFNFVYMYEAQSVPTSGGTITLRGKSLSSGSGTGSTLTLNNTVDLSETQSASNTNGTFAMFTFPQATAETLSGRNIQVGLNIRGRQLYSDPGQVYFSKVTMSFQPPTLANVNFDYTANQLSIIGTNFGANLGQVSVTCSGETLKLSSFIKTHTQLLISNKDLSNFMNKTFISSGEFGCSITVVGQTGSNSFKLVPQIDSVTSTSSATGGPITISGKRLNYVRPNGTVSTIDIKIGSFSCEATSTEVIGNAYIICRMPKTSDTNIYNLPVTVTIDGLASLSNTNFSYDLPNVLSNSQLRENLIVKGSQFGTDLTNIKFFFNGTQVPIVQLTDVVMVVQLPSDIKAGHYTNSYIIKYQSAKTSTFAVDVSPFIKNVSQPPTGGGIVTISGSYLASNLDVNEYNITFGTQQQFTCTNASGIDSHTITCLAGPGTGGQNPVQITLNSQSISSLNSPVYLSYQSPVILSSNSVSSYGGDLTISGDNFGYTGVNSSLLSIFIDNTKKCFNPVALDAATITCRMIGGQFDLPPPENTFNITVTVQGLKGTNNTFTLDNSRYYQLVNEEYNKERAEDESKQMGLVGIVLPAVVLGGILMATIIILAHHQILYSKAIRSGKLML
ncbi:hypothetical protein SAMD00019534_018830 [Acytostelium subglobosum LB1]|uniref:hypothetical protein n=1 Tax=Acytostelium subglobosum LB1 TaxID=1410327 RepID=UPI0006447ED4|nr:hypothetical protein SAMD00019534_018830 [Acytostelium subglobosum LB1]GAM18708.1 hypothetical protein SAMD00019534_018830 [Acytostelium subglobosum LB1]|eukprot:XP_012757928.1 hypothetical protein SAMD00019534_018830 [Acytostelium subglobosum LB1]